MNINQHRTSLARSAQGDVFARLSQRLEKFLERERRANQAYWDLIEEEKLMQARLALFGSAPK